MTKTLIKAALAATVATGLFAAPAMAANTATKPFTATAKIVKPLTLTKVRDLNFGTITMLSGLTSSVVAVDQADAASCGSNLSCTAPVSAKFSVAGVALQTLDVDVQAITALTDPVSGETVAFNADAPSTVTLLADGSGKFNIGGDITVTAANDDGVYSADIDVTVSYQ